MGNYISNNLMLNEEVVHETHHHWVHFLSMEGILTLFLLPMVEYYTHEFVVTNYRIVMKTGLLRIWSAEMTISQVEAVLVDQSFLGRIFGYGNLIIIGSGGTREYINTIRNPLLFRRRFMEVQIGVHQ